METRGQIKLCIGETLPHEFLVVKKLPMDCEVLIGQDWLERFGYQFQIPELGITLPAYSEKIVRIPTTERGSRLAEPQELQENVLCASSIVECTDASFSCLIMNCNGTDQLLRKFPQTRKLPKLSCNFSKSGASNIHSLNQVLQTQLRLAHVKEGVNMR